MPAAREYAGKIFVYLKNKVNRRNITVIMCDFELIMNKKQIIFLLIKEKV